jgi:hypothetical protein
LRALFQSEEGQRLSTETDGVLELIEVALWTMDLDLEARIYLQCGDERFLARTFPLSSGLIPRFEGIWSELAPIVIPVDPPLALPAGQVFEIVFRAPDLATGGSGISGVFESNKDPASRFVSENYAGTSRDVDWDYAVAAYIH